VTWFYNSFRPLVNRPAGRVAAETFGLPPFIDGSCRREPDLESQYPSISALCRASKFAPRLSVGDAVIYVTVKGRWNPVPERHRRLVAVLQVRERFPHHEAAADWYRELGLPLPSNCMVRGNGPIPYQQTVQDQADPERWNLGYMAVARAHPVFLATDPLHLNMNDPPVVTDEILRTVFGREPGTQNPPQITQAEADQLLDLVGVELPLVAAPTGRVARAS
jgi:hypothetical protein